MNLVRPNNWPEKLHLFIEEKRHQPFDWATNNCAFFSSDWIAILTGYDPAKTLRPKVTSAITAARILGKRGGVEGIAEKICKKQGWGEVPPLMARRGDIALLDTPEGLAMGVCVGSMVAFAGPEGVEFLPVAKCRRTWGIAWAK